ncbi:NAD(P)/FAD-dependent oxidoreductase [Thalassotalea castellviae]|uniref:FAD-binding oxidoreductase n=1 Tax=Thalassotalea castellviae TaxID=3075612 RepID=A0ABU3A155_9GAMM|nr:FAD-binding oxidoreductase [Thalassotalea sp. W431]MDT0603906.1 FAD-binding oxidoreductase [Thalassotalea sp. W431]
MSAIHSDSYPHSYYFSTMNHASSYPHLSEAIEADVCIVGGGFSGIASAVELAERGFNVVLLEAKKIAWGASGRNGGQMIRGIGHDLSAFKKQIGHEGVDAISQMGFEANQVVIDRITKYNIKCDLTMGYCDLATRTKDMHSLEQDYELLSKGSYGVKVELLDQQQLHQQVVGSQRFIGGLTDVGSGHLHPLNLCLGEAKVAHELGVRLFENSQVIKIEKGETIVVHTEHGRVKAKQMILAGNAYLGELVPKISGKILPAGSYIIATEQLPEDLHQAILPNNHAVCDMKIDLDYFRLSADKRLLFGGMCNYSGRDPKDIKAALHPKMLKVFPELSNIKIDFQWGGMIGIGANRLPQIGRLTPNIYYAQAYSGHGVNVTHMAAKLLAQAISGNSQEFEYFNEVKHMTFPGGRHLRSPLLALGMMYHKMIDAF